MARTCSINNAGVMLLGAVLLRAAGSELRQMVEVNLLGAMTDDRSLPRPAARRRRRSREHLVGGRTHRPRWQRRSMPRRSGALNGWSEALRQELQPDIRVIVIEPGAVATELTDHITDPRRQAGRRAVLRAARHLRRGHRGDHRVRRSRDRGASRSTRSLLRPTAQAG